MLDKLSEETQKIIKKHIETGYVIDPYSDIWVQAHEGVELINDQCESLVSAELLSSFDEEDGDNFRNHLLIIYVESHNEELVRDLSSLDPAFRFIFEEKKDSMHWPNFFFINIPLDQVFAVGIGRKYDLFCYDVKEYASGKVASVSSSELFHIYGRSGDYLTKFKELDYWYFVANIVQNLELFANSMNKWNSLFQDYDDEEPYTDPMNACNEDLELSIAALTVYFPMIDEGNLNPQDY